MVKPQSVLKRTLVQWKNLPCGSLLVALWLLGSTVLSGHAQERFITVASTTSTEQSGLFDYLLPLFEKDSGIAVRVVAVGTGQAITLARNGDADVLFVHHKPSEEAFVAEGFGLQRFDVMYNDFVLVGPRTDPASIAKMRDALAALQRVAQKQATFVSRGDDSGTHKLELSLWNAANIAVKTISGTWYRETGAGMGPTLNTASGMGAYVLTDRSTWLNFANRGDLTILVEGDPRLFNQYGVILVNPAKHAHVKAKDGQLFIDWVLSERGQNALASYRIQGEQAFFPNARKSGS